MCGTEGCRVRVSMKNSPPSSATKVISTCAILSLAVHRGPSSFTIDTHKLSRSLYLSYDLDILKKKKINEKISLLSHLPLGRELLDFVFSPWENLTHNRWQWMLGGFEVLMKSTGLGLKLEDIPSKKWSQARRCRISAEKAHPGHGFCSL